MTNFDFNSRETYLAYRADWKVRYRMISEEIRQTKRSIMEAHKAGFENCASGYQSALHYERQTANQLMLELAAAKQFKNDQLVALNQLAA